MKLPNLEQLSPEQRKAVIWNEGPLLLLAGPGSGKTHTIIHRLIHLLNLGISPETILVITFTKEAATSMQRRFFQTYQQNVPIQFATFHSFFYQILRYANPNHPLSIITTGRKRLLLHKLLENKTSIRFDTREETAEQIDTLISAISYYKNTQDYEATRNMLEGPFRSNFELLFKMYRREMQKINCIDFDDMLYDCLKLLQRDKNCCQYWQKRFRYFLIDEFQDINPLQYEIMKLLVGKPYNLFAVGDDDQSIYGFRGSNPDIMFQFTREYGATTYYLENNYRSGEEIIQASGIVIQENANRFQKQFHSGTGDIESRVVCKAFENRPRQTEYVKEKINQFLSEYKGTNQNMVILFRTNAYMQGMAARLLKAGIPYGMKESCKSIYEHNVVKDICAYLQLAMGEWSRPAMLRIMNKPIRFISPDAVADSHSLTDVIQYYEINKRDGKQNHAEIESLRKLQRHLEVMSHMSLKAAIHYICKVIPYERYLLAGLRNEPEKLVELGELLTWLKEDVSNYPSFHDWIEAQKKYELMLEQNQKTTIDRNQPIQLMTIHSAKGLEFHTVLIPDCNEKIYPHGRLPEKNAVEEERRIFYVGMTRASKNLELLYVTGTKEYPKAVSRFLKPLLEHKKPTANKCRWQEITLHQPVHQIRSCQDIPQMHL